MKFQCPYCKSQFDPQKGAKCPSCGKAMLISEAVQKKAGIKATGARKSAPTSRPIGQRELSPAPIRPWAIRVLLVVACLVGLTLWVSIRSRPQPAGSSAGAAAPGLERLAKAQHELHDLRVALELFEKHCGRYPTEEENLRALVVQSFIQGDARHLWYGPYLSLVQPDPWKNPYVYKLVDGDVLLYSLGPDGEDKTLDELYAPPMNVEDIEALADRLYHEAQARKRAKEAEE